MISQKVSAYRVAENVRNCGHPMPANEYQARLLATVPAEVQTRLWAQLVSHTSPAQITGSMIQQMITAYRHEVNSDVQSGVKSSVVSAISDSQLGIPWCWSVLQVGKNTQNQSVLLPLSDLHGALATAAPTIMPSDTGSPIVFISPEYDVCSHQVAPVHREEILAMMQQYPTWRFLVWTATVSALERIQLPPNVELGLRVSTQHDVTEWESRSGLSTLHPVTWIWWTPREPISLPRFRWQRVVMGAWHRADPPVMSSCFRSWRLALADALQLQASVHLPRVAIEAILRGIQ